MIKIFLSKQSFSKKVAKPPLDLGALRNPLLINLSQLGEFGQFGDSVFELLIRSLRMTLYLLKTTAILDFSSTSPITCLNTCFQRIVTI